MKRTPIQESLASLEKIRKWLERIAKQASLSAIDRAVGTKSARELHNAFNVLKQCDRSYKGWSNQQTAIVHEWMTLEASKWTTAAKEELVMAPTNERCQGRNPVWTADVCARIMLAERIKKYYKPERWLSDMWRDLAKFVFEDVNWVEIAASYLD